MILKIIDSFICIHAWTHLINLFSSCKNLICFIREQQENVFFLLLFIFSIFSLLCLLLIWTKQFLMKPKKKKKKVKPASFSPCQNNSLTFNYVWQIITFGSNSIDKNNFSGGRIYKKHSIINWTYPYQTSDPKPKWLS